MNAAFPWWAVPVAVVPAAICVPAHAVQYLTVEQAQRALFPEAERFPSRPVVLDPQQRKTVEDYAGVRMRTERQPVWRAERNGELLGWFVLDEVYGKHEFITYAVALNTEGAVQGIEVLDYRETHGGEIRNPHWREQFQGKHYGDTLKLGDDIQNISGATLSCKHVTEGVRRILALHRVALR